MGVIQKLLDSKSSSSGASSEEIQEIEKKIESIQGQKYFWNKYDPTINTTLVHEESGDANPGMGDFIGFELSVTVPITEGDDYKVTFYDGTDNILYEKIVTAELDRDEYLLVLTNDGGEVGAISSIPGVGAFAMYEADFAKVKIETVDMVLGDLIETVESTNNEEYPIGGFQGDFYYTRDLTIMERISKLESDIEFIMSEVGPTAPVN